MGTITENFSLSEFASHDGKPVPPEKVPRIKELAENLEVLRGYLHGAIKINSGYRSPAHNKQIGGKVNSQHLQGRAADIVVRGFTPRQVQHAIEVLIAHGKMKQGGLGSYKTFTHYDIRGYSARWSG